MQQFGYLRDSADMIGRLRRVGESFNDWEGGRGCHKIIPVLGGDGTKIAPPGDTFDQPLGKIN